MAVGLSAIAFSIRWTGQSSHKKGRKRSRRRKCVARAAPLPENWRSQGGRRQSLHRRTGNPGGHGIVGPGTSFAALPKIHLKTFQTDPGNRWPALNRQLLCQARIRRLPGQYRLAISFPHARAAVSPALHKVQTRRDPALSGSSLAPRLRTR